DRNVTPGDGCSFDCASDETCGNGIVDYFAGEVCDDANLTPYDGCSRTCTPDIPPVWTTRVTDTPFPRTHAAAAYDVRRQRMVLFGGNPNGLRSNETWEWDGTAWLRRFPLTVPLARQTAAMAYDLKRGRTLLYGGQSGIGVLADLWQWDGNDWTLLDAAV